MSRDAYLVCHETRMFLPLGKIIFDGSPSTYFHSGTEHSKPNWQQLDTNQLLWKFLARHLGHDLLVCSSDELDEDKYESYCRVDDDGVNDISADDFLRDWPGIF